VTNIFGLNLNKKILKINFQKEVNSMATFQPHTAFMTTNFPQPSNFFGCLMFGKWSCPRNAFTPHPHRENA